MSYGAAHTRVAIVIRPLDRALRVGRFLLVTLLLVSGGVPLLAQLTSAHAKNALSIEVVTFALLVGGLSLALLQSEAIGGRIDRLLAAARRRVALGCDHVTVGAHRESRIACHLTPELLRVPLFAYKEQQHVVMRLLDACTEATHGAAYWVIEGESGSGKTRTGLMLAQALARHRDHYVLGSRCFLYDLNRSQRIESQLVRRLGSRRHNDAVVLVDNVQEVSEDGLARLTQYLTGRTDHSERLVVLLTRPPPSWRLGGGADVELVSRAKARASFHRLEGPRRETVEESVAVVDAAASQLLGDLQPSAIASATQLHLAQAIARGKSISPALRAVLELVAGQRDTAGSAGPLLSTLGTIAGLSTHRGRFTRRELLAAARVASDGPRAAIRVAWTFRRLRKLGFVSRAEHDDAQYVFHESVAEYCTDQLWNLAEFQDAFVSVVGRRLVKLGNAEVAGAWMLAVERGAQPEMAAAFDGAMARGSYHRMVRCLQRADERYPLTERSQLQLAILLNRVGEFTASRQLFADDRIADIEADGDLALMLLSSRMEATHDAAAEKALVALRHHSDPRVAIVGEYWQIHMAAHRGEFASARLLALADQSQTELRDDDGYWHVYALARMHFDSLRHHYLEGAPPVSPTDAAIRRSIDRRLRDRLPTHQALGTLYGKAHLVGHVLLPRLAIFSEPVGHEDARVADVPGDGADITVDVLVRAAQSHYAEAQLLFSQAGDRESRYLTADILNLKMVEPSPDPGTIEQLLHAYEALGQQHFRLIASYPHYYWMKWHVLEFSRHMSTAGNTHDASQQLAMARARLTTVERLDLEVGNEYGVLRARMLRLLLDSTESPLDLNALGKLRSEMAAHSYGFEARLLAHIAVQADDMSLTDLIDVFRYYPFVHQ